jgi:hypothetical protein
MSEPLAAARGRYPRAAWALTGLAAAQAAFWTAALRPRAAAVAIALLWAACLGLAVARAVWRAPVRTAAFLAGVAAHLAIVGAWAAWAVWGPGGAGVQ